MCIYIYIYIYIYISAALSRPAVRKEVGRNTRKVDTRLPEKEFKLPCCKAGLLNHLKFGPAGCH